MTLVNARFLTQKITGVQRFAIEISKYLKKEYKTNIKFLCPKNVIHGDLAKELDVEIIGKRTGHLWEQIDLPKYLKSIDSPLLLNMANTAPVFYKNKMVTIHDLAFLHHPQWFSRKFTFFYNLLIPNISKNSEHIFTVSDYVKRDISKSYNISESKISVIHNSYADVFKYQCLKHEDYVLAVGSIDPRKNLESLIDIFKRMDTKLIIVGQKSKVFSALDINNLPENIIFTGYVDDEKLVELYNKAQLFIYPSLFEGFGIPPLEAQACGCPVVCSNQTSLPEVGANSVIYCNPYKIDDIEKKIKLVLNDEKLHRELIIKGFENIKRFSWGKSAKKVINIIEEKK